MGTPGVKLEYTKAQIANVILNSKGYAVNCMNALDCREEYFYNKLNEYPELKVLLEEQRSKRRKNLVLKAETLLEWTMDNKEEMPGVAQKSAFYILDNQAKDMGYNKTEDGNKPIPREEQISLEQENIDLKYENMQLKNDSERQADNQLQGSDGSI